MSVFNINKIHCCQLMKAISLILVLFLINSICKAQGTVTGNIVYANSALTSIHDSTLVRLYQGTTL